MRDFQAAVAKWTELMLKSGIELECRKVPT